MATRWGEQNLKYNDEGAEERREKRYRIASASQQEDDKSGWGTQKGTPSCGLRADEGGRGVSQKMTIADEGG